MDKSRGGELYRNTGIPDLPYRKNTENTDFSVYRSFRYSIIPYRNLRYTANSVFLVFFQYDKCDISVLRYILPALFIDRRIDLLPPSLKISHLFPFSSVLKNLSPFTFTIFGSRLHIPLTHSPSHFILKLIYKSRTHMPLTFSTHFLLHFLKLVPGQMVTKFGGRGSISI